MDINDVEKIAYGNSLSDLEQQEIRHGENSLEEAVEVVFDMKAETGIIKV